MAEDVQDKDLIFQGNQITKTYRSRAHSFTLEPIDVALYVGEITAVVGENGDGKTTLLNMISGQLSLTGGKVKYPYLEQQGITTTYKTKRYIATLSQELPSWPGKLVENLHFHAALRGIKGEENEVWVMFILDRLGLMKYKDATWKQISGGYRTRFSLALSLVKKPNLLVLDEPLANLDINTQLVFLDDLRDLVRTLEQPVAMVISSQHLHEIERISDNIIFIRDGKTIYNGSKADFAVDREENTFELTSSLTEDEIRNILTDMGLISISAAGENYLLHFPRAVESDVVLKALMDGGAKITMFRDISQSTRKLFQVEV